FAPQDLSTAIQGKDRESSKTHGKGRPRKGPDAKEQLLSDNEKNAKESAQDNRLTSVERLNLALQAAKGVQALHQSDVMHADITAKQFLVTTKSCNNHTNTENEPSCKKLSLKINDFNRCRFIPHKVSNATTTNTIEKCSIRIPSAPGLYRSPEEYAAQNLTAEIDIFSLGNVLYELWTGKEPWDDVGGKLVRQHVQEGHLPSGLAEILQSKGGDNGLDHAMAKVIARCYEVNPQSRITADELVNELEHLMQQA
ncbi:MAG: hypothetical protein SGILL_010680, partial [Bacillariaceae sp.]